MDGRYQPLVVESVAAQRYISQMICGQMATVPVRNSNTGRGKMSLQFRAEAVAVEMSRGQWTMRGSDTSEVAGLIKDMIFYEPLSHCGDRLVSLMLTRWGAEQSSLRVEYPNVDFSRR